MLQILQSLSTGETLLAEVPCPAVRAGCLLIANRASVVSLGTERMLVEFGKGNLLAKARQQPEKVRQVIEKLRTDGLIPTLEAVRAKLDQPITLGYSSAGVVLEVGAGVEGFAPGDRVMSNGPHAEVVCVPRNLCARIPEGVSFEKAAFTVVGSVALEGIRLANPTLGESVAVIGLGLIGLLCVQLLRADGCRVLGIDLDPAKCALARRFGAETVDLSQEADPVTSAMAFSRGRGMDAVIVTASTRSNDPMHQAAQMSRKRGRIVLVGVVGLELSRADFYDKELTFQVSCSYGPGRYDPTYEQKGHDYPLGYVRWTEGRNFEAVLDMMAEGKLDPMPLISHRFPFERATEAYTQATSGGGALGILLEYPEPTIRVRERSVAVGTKDAGRPQPVSQVTVGVIGAGGFAGQVLLPALKKTGARMAAICSSGGVSANYLARKFGAEQATTDAELLIQDPAINTIVIATRHNTHARYVLAALRAGKRVFVEKPLCLTRDELTEIEAAVSAHGPAFLMVGFNRRFSPLAVKMRSLLASAREPKTLIVTVNAGSVPPEHWTVDPATGGGRIIGEGCHFVDLLRFLAGAPIVGVQAAAACDAAGVIQEDRMTFTLTFVDGSVGTVHYFSNGSKAFPKERVEAFCAGRVLQLDNWRRLRGFGWPGFRGMAVRRQDKGHAAEMRALVQAIQRGESSPIPFDDIVEVTRVTFDVVEQAMLGSATRPA